MYKRQGFTRAKNTGNILMKNMMDFCIGTPCSWIIGFGLLFGGTGALIGGFDPFIPDQGAVRLMGEQNQACLLYTSQCACCACFPARHR